MATDPLSPTVQESSGRVRLCLGNLAHGDGPTLQDAADDLVQRLLHELGEIAATGGDIREWLFSEPAVSVPVSVHQPSPIGLRRSGWIWHPI